MLDTFLIKQKLNQIPGFEKNKRIIKQTIGEIKYFSFDKADLKYFALISRGRSGTTCLLDILTCHPQILADVHYLYDDYGKLPANFGQQQFIYSRKNVRGCKLTTLPDELEKNSINAQRIREGFINLAKKGVVLFYLKRNNLLKRSISIEVAKTKNRWNTLNPGKDRSSIDRPSFELDPTSLLQRIQRCEEEMNYDQEVLKGVPHTALNYEQDLEKEEYHQKTLDKICQVLQIDSAPAVTRYVKLAPEKISDYILNYDEIVQTVSNSPYAKYLEQQ